MNDFPQSSQWLTPDSVRLRDEAVSDLVLLARCPAKQGLSQHHRLDSAGSPTYSAELIRTTASVPRLFFTHCFSMHLFASFGIRG
jgi:hypothetical protein